jgi:hypothetical protein
MSFTRNEMLCYYVVETKHVCTHCCKVAARTLSDKIMVEFVGENNHAASLPLSTILSRYVKMHPSELTQDKAFALLPKLPFKTKSFEQEVSFCQDCLPETLGSEEEDAFPIFVPAPQSKALGDAYSGNLPEPPITGKKTKQTSRKLKRETPEEKAKREKLAAIKRGDISALL